jgi:hypothetical protein
LGRIEETTMKRSQLTALLTGLVVAYSVTPSASEQQCRPSLSSKASGHSEVVDQQRKWTAVLDVDASSCASAAGSFEIEFVRQKEFGPDLTFTERFTWRPGKTEVALDIWWDEWLDAHRISKVAPCPCRDLAYPDQTDVQLRR